MASVESTIKDEQTDAFSIPRVIPPEHAHKTLVLCFDGTGDQFDADNSNIVQLVSLLKKDDRNKQMVYYQVGLQLLKVYALSLRDTIRLGSVPTPLLDLCYCGQLSKRCVSQILWYPLVMNMFKDSGYNVCVESASSCYGWI